MARAAQLKLRENVRLDGVKGGVVVLGAIRILGIAMVRTAGGAVIAVVARGILRFDGARTNRAGGGADGAIEQSDDHESGYCEFGAQCRGRRHGVNYIIVCLATKRGGRHGRKRQRRNEYHRVVTYDRTRAKIDD